MKCDCLAIDVVAFGTGRDRAALVSGDRATAGIADTGDRYALHFHMAGLGAEHLATMGGSIAESDDVVH